MGDLGKPLTTMMMRMVEMGIENAPQWAAAARVARKLDLTGGELMTAYFSYQHNALNVTGNRQW